MKSFKLVMFGAAGHLSLKACRIRCFSLLAILAMSSEVPAGQEIGDLRWVNPAPQGLTLSDVHYADDRFLAVGFGVGVVSPDGINWDVIKTPGGVNLRGVTYGSGRWVAVGQSGSGAVSVVSTDGGATWTSHPISGSRGIPLLKAVASDGTGTFVAVGYYLSGTSPIIIFQSDDGETWTELQELPEGGELNNVSYLNGEFVAVGAVVGSFGGLILASDDGVVWEKLWDDDKVFLTGIAFNGSTYAATSFLRLVSGDMLDSSLSSQSQIGSRYYDIAAGDGTFVAVGEGQLIKRSTNGTDWNEESLFSQGDLLGVAYGSGTFVAVGDSGIILSWPESGPGPWQRPAGTVDGVQNLIGVAVGPTAVLALDQYGAILKSTDGLSWESSYGAVGEVSILEYVDGRWYEAGTDDFSSYRLHTSSDDGGSWEMTDLEASVPIVGLAYGGGRLVAAAGNFGRTEFFSSEDGDAWTPAGSFSTSAVRSITHGDGKFVAVSDSDSYTSVDGVNWIHHPTASLSSIRSIAFGASTFVAVGVNATYYSSDGETWISATLPGFPNLNHVMWVDGAFIASGTDVILTSVDGMTWSQENPFSFGTISSAAGNGDACVFVGNGALILITGVFDIKVPPVPAYPDLSDFGRDEFGTNRMTIKGLSGVFYTIYFSPDLINWDYVTDVEGTPSGFLFEDFEFRDPSRGFYRAEGPGE